MTSYAAARRSALTSAPMLCVCASVLLLGCEDEVQPASYLPSSSPAPTSSSGAPFAPGSVGNSAGGSAGSAGSAGSGAAAGSGGSSGSGGAAAAISEAACGDGAALAEFANETGPVYLAPAIDAVWMARGTLVRRFALVDGCPSGASTVQWASSTGTIAAIAATANHVAVATTGGLRIFEQAAPQNEAACASEPYVSLSATASSINFIASGGGGAMRVFAAQPSSCVETTSWPSPASPVWAMASDAAAQRLWTIAASPTPKVFASSLSDGGAQTSSFDSAPPSLCAANGALIDGSRNRLWVSQPSCNELGVWSTDSGALLGRWQGGEKSISAMVLLADGRVLWAEQNPAGEPLVKVGSLP